MKYVLVFLLLTLSRQIPTGEKLLCKKVHGKKLFPRKSSIMHPQQNSKYASEYSFTTIHEFSFHKKNSLGTSINLNVGQILLSRIKTFQDIVSFLYHMKISENQLYIFREVQKRTRTTGLKLVNSFLCCFYIFQKIKDER